MFAGYLCSASAQHAITHGGLLRLMFDVEATGMCMLMNRHVVGSSTTSCTTFCTTTPSIHCLSQGEPNLIPFAFLPRAGRMAFALAWPAGGPFDWLPFGLSLEYPMEDLPLC